jgi:hypothetical protein
MSMNPRLLRPKATSGFDPRRIANLTGWWDSTDNATITTDTGVSVWVDKSGNGYTLTQSTGANQPTLSAISGKQAFSYNGTTQSLRSTSAGLLALFSGVGMRSYTCFSVFQKPSARADCIIGLFTGGSNSQYSAVRAASNRSMVIEHGSATETVTSTDAASYANNTPCLLSFVVSPTYKLRTNGLERISAASSKTGDTLNFNRFSLGVLDRFSTAAFFQGIMGDVLIYNRVLLDAEISSVERWLAAKFGATLGCDSLPPPAALCTSRPA